MSVRCMAVVFDAQLEDLKYKKGEETLVAKASTCKLMLLAYADHANDEGEAAYPGYNRLIQKTCLSRQGVANTIEALRQNNLLIADGVSNSRTNRYTINLPLLRQTTESSHLTPPSQATRLVPVKPLDLNHPLTINKPSLATDVAGELPLDWQIATGQPAKEPQDNFLFQAEDAAHLMSINAVDVKPLAMAFMQERRIICSLDKKSLSAWRAAFREMLAARPHQVRPEHVRGAIAMLNERGLTIADPHSIKKTAIALANPTTNGGVSVPAEIVVDENGIPESF